MKGKAGGVAGRDETKVRIAQGGKVKIKQTFVYCVTGNDVLNL